MTAIGKSDWTSRVRFAIVIWCNANNIDLNRVLSRFETGDPAGPTWTQPRNDAWIIGCAETQKGFGRSSVVHRREHRRRATSLESTRQL